MTVRILFVEDSQDDVELQLRRLREAGLEPQWDRVQTEEALRAALEDESWQIALVDYNIPGFSGIEALHLIAEMAPDLPAITVSGSIDEDTAVATMSAGAVDYVLKDNLTRLPQAVQRSVDGADLRRAHRHAAEAARLALFALDHASLTIATVASDGTVVYANGFASASFGMERSEIIGRRLWELDPLVNVAGWQAEWAETVEHGVRDFRLDRRRPDGTGFVLDVTANYLEGADLLISYGRDVTARVAAEEHARASEAQYRRIVELADEGVWACDRQSVTTFVNARMAAMLGYEPEEMVGRPDTDFAHPDDLPLHEREGERLRQGKPGSYQGRYIARDGCAVWMNISSVADLGPDGEFAGSFALCTDITERKRAEDALRAEQEEVRRTAEQLRRTVEGAVLAMSHIVETRDPYTAGHERRVAELATAIGEEMGMDGAELNGLRLGSLIHDIGKISVPAEILAKPGRLSPVEFNLIKQHAQAGYEILSVIDFGRPVAEMVLQHHERLDGTGYPNGLSAADLLPETCILAVADVVEAMSSHRPYRAALGTEAALAEIRDGAGTRYDAEVAAACRRVMEEQGFAFTP